MRHRIVETCFSIRPIPNANCHCFGRLAYLLRTFRAFEDSVGDISCDALGAPLVVERMVFVDTLRGSTR